MTKVVVLGFVLIMLIENLELDTFFKLLNRPKNCISLVRAESPMREICPIC